MVWDGTVAFAVESLELKVLSAEYPRLTHLGLEKQLFEFEGGRRSKAGGRRFRARQGLGPLLSSCPQIGDLEGA